MEASCSELRKEIYCVIKVCYRFRKIASEIVKSIKGACKDKCFRESSIFRWLGYFSRESLSAELAPKPGLR